jgi:hypothetical protein
MGKTKNRKDKVGKLKRRSLINLTVAVVAAVSVASAGYYLISSKAAVSPDLNGDGKVDVMDMSLLLGNWGDSGTGIKGDINTDGSVNVMDLSILLSKWGAVAPTPPPTPPPTTGTGTFFGACPANPGGTSLTAATTVISKWGTGAGVRQFVGSTISSGPNHPTGASIVHTSYKVDVAQVNSGALDAQIEALVNRTPAGDVIEFHHEPNNNGLTGQGITDMINAKNRLYEIKQRVKPSVLIAATMTGGFFANYTTESARAPWYGLKGDLIGLDADGVHDSTGPTYDITYDDEIAGVKAFMARNAANGWKGWSVPEFGTSRQDWDTTGTPRASWINREKQKFIDGGARYVMWYDYDTGEHASATNYNQIRSGTPEFTAWKNLILGNPHTP